MSFGSLALSDLDAVFADTGDTALYVHDGGSDTINGMFENDYFSVNSVSQIESSKPAFICKTTDAPDAIHGETLVVNSELWGIVDKSYKVEEIQRSPSGVGPGGTRLVLKEA